MRAGVGLEGGRVRGGGTAVEAPPAEAGGRELTMPDEVWRGAYARLRAEGDAAGSVESVSRQLEKLGLTSRQLERLGLAKKSPSEDRSAGSEEAFFTLVWGNVVPRLQRAPAA